MHQISNVKGHLVQKLNCTETKAQSSSIAVAVTKTLNVTISTLHQHSMNTTYH